MFKVLSLAAAVLMVAAVAFGGVVDPCNSSVSTTQDTVGVMICPAGDGDQMGDVGATIYVTVLDGSSNPIEGVPATDFWLIDCDPTGDMILCNGSSSSNADSATGANGQTTMSGDISAGGCADGLSVIVQGYAIGCPATCLDKIRVMSPDMNGDLTIILNDFTNFKGFYQPSYGKCADFNRDGSVGLQDLSIFALHYKHSCP